MYSYTVQALWFCTGRTAYRGRSSITVLFLDHGTRRGEGPASRPGRSLLPCKDPVPIVQEAGWAPVPIWTDGKSRPHCDSIPDHPAGSPVTLPTELPGPQQHKILTGKSSS